MVSGSGVAFVMWTVTAEFQLSSASQRLNSGIPAVYLNPLAMNNLERISADQGGFSRLSVLDQTFTHMPALLDSRGMLLPHDAALSSHDPILTISQVKLATTDAPQQS